ncbi:hypothetical protein BDV39DRAFT_182592 [Aspergillus sergii]|uniref:Uncharacterized protein n=1 Tax=Aspergillus sergii TaxID=1034303 RepID=A0A5N6WRP6_9EURO|nr:hypothetical protein BDV39DRAFT_182592 [Aspergillus sergii]
MFSAAGQKRRLSLQVNFVLRTGKWETCKANETSKGECLVGMVRDRLTIIPFFAQQAAIRHMRTDLHTHTHFQLAILPLLFPFYSLYLSPPLLFFSSFLVFLFPFQSSSQSVDFAH